MTRPAKARNKLNLFYFSLFNSIQFNITYYIIYFALSEIDDVAGPQARPGEPTPAV